MILTVMFNPSVDKLYRIAAIQPETVMRVMQVHNSAGGKGLNVSRVAAKLGEDVTAMGFVGGYNGQYLESLAVQPRLQCAFTHVAAETRCCINCWDCARGKSTEYLEPGAPISRSEVEQFFTSFDERLASADAVTVSGSAPQGVTGAAYIDIISRCKRAGVPVLMDTSGKLLDTVVKAQPTFVKPNMDEIAQLTGMTPSSREELIEAAQKLHQTGIGLAAISMGSDGVLLACDEGVYHGQPPCVSPKNTVGCGDCMVAGFAVGIARQLPIVECIRMAVAVSAASALSPYTGDFDWEDYDGLYPNIVIEKAR